MGIRSVGVLCNRIWSIVENGLGRAKARVHMCVRTQMKIWGSTPSRISPSHQLPYWERICQQLASLKS